MIDLIIPACGSAFVTGGCGVLMFFLQRNEKKRQEEELKKAEAREKEAEEMKEWQERVENKMDVITKCIEKTKEATRASLHDRLKWECERIILQEYRTPNDGRNLTYMFKGYEGIDGNSIIEDLFTEAMKQPIKPKERGYNERKSLPAS